MAEETIAADIQDAEPKDNIAYWVLGDAEAYPELNRLKFVRHYESSVDALLVLPGVSEHELESALAEHQCWLLPVVVFGDVPSHRADYQAESVTRFGLDDAALKLKPLLQKIKLLPEFQVPGDRAALSLLALAWSRETSLNACWAPQSASMVDYGLLLGIPSVPKLLQELAANDLLSRRPFDRVHLCNQCESSRLNVREECAKCHSSYLQEVPLVHHYTCSYQAPEGQFIQQRQLVCPKCHKELRHYGVDYDKPGTLFVCQSCSHSASEPEVGFVCTDCGHHQSAETVVTRDWFHYGLTNDGVNSLKNGLLPVNTIGQLFRQLKGYYRKHEFLLAGEICSRVAKRYDRPIAACVIEIKNIEELNQSIGARSLNKSFLLLNEVVAQNLRNTDLLTAENEQLFLLLPETLTDHLDLVIERITSTVDESLKAKLEWDIRKFDAENILTLFEEF